MRLFMIRHARHRNAISSFLFRAVKRGIGHL